MQADFSVELGGDSPALEIPWSSDDPNVRYLDLKNHQELIKEIAEAVAYPELGSFLARINAPGFPLATAKCDAWASNEVAPEEEIFGDRKFVSYIDLIFVDEKDRCSFEKNEAFAQQLCRLLGHAPEIAATVELVIRHCYWHEESTGSNDGSGAGAGDSSGSEDSSAFKNSSAPEGGDLSGDSSATKASTALKHSSAVNSSAVENSFDVAGYNECARSTAHQEFTRGFCVTAYVTGFGNMDHDPLRQWTIGLNLLLHAIVQLSSNSQPKP